MSVELRVGPTRPHDWYEVGDPDFPDEKCDRCGAVWARGWGDTIDDVPPCER